MEIKLPTKKEVRRLIFQRRKAADEEQLLRDSERIAERVFSLPEYQRAERLLVYLDYNREVSTRELIRKAWEDGKEVAVPRVEGSRMVFYRITDFSHLVLSGYGIQEPDPEFCPAVDWQEALMIMPGVAFDGALHRVGYGGGFYDRYLELHPGIYTVAVAFGFQVLEEVPTEETDICPRVLVTERDTRS